RVRVPVLEIGRLLAIAKHRAFEDEHLDVLGVLVEVRQVGADAVLDRGDWILALDGRGRLEQTLHDRVDPAVEEGLLAREVAIERPFRAAGIRGDRIEIRACIAISGEVANRVPKDLCSPPSRESLVPRAPAPGRTGRFSCHRRVLPRSGVARDRVGRDPRYMTDGSVT